MVQSDDDTLLTPPSSPETTPSDFLSLQMRRRSKEITNFNIGDNKSVIKSFSMSCPRYIFSVLSVLYCPLFGVISMLSDDDSHDIHFSRRGKRQTKIQRRFCWIVFSLFGVCEFIAASLRLLHFLPEIASLLVDLII